MDSFYFNIDLYCFSPEFHFRSWRHKYNYNRYIQYNQIIIDKILFYNRMIKVEKVCVGTEQLQINGTSRKKDNTYQIEVECIFRSFVIHFTIQYPGARVHMNTEFEDVGVVHVLQ